MSGDSAGKSSKYLKSVEAKTGTLQMAIAVNDWQEVSRSVEAEIGLEASDYFDRERLRAKIEVWRERHDVGAVILFLLPLANSLNMLERFADMMILLEGFFGLTDQDYFDRELLTARLEAAGLPPEVPQAKNMLLFQLAGALGLNGRLAESAAIFRELLGVGDGFAPGETRRRVDGLLETLPFGAVVCQLQLLVSGDGQKTDAAILLESIAGFTPDDYRQPDVLVAKMRDLRERLLNVAEGLLVLQVLGNSLLEADRSADAWALLAADLERDPHDLDPIRFIAALRARYQSLPEDLTTLYFQQILPIIRATVRPGLLAAALDLEAGLEDVDWHDRQALANQFDMRVRRLAEGTASGYVAEIATSFGQAGEHEKAFLLIDAYLQGERRIREQGDHPTLVVRLCPLYTYWLSAWCEDVSRQPYAVCRTLVTYLRKTLAEHGATLQDREIFLRLVGELRRRIIQTGLFWAKREADSDKARQTWHEVLFWDLELAQQLLIERFLLAGIRRLAATEPPAAGCWPWQKGKGERKPTTEGYLPPVDESEALAGVLGEIAAPTVALTTPEPMDPGSRLIRPYERLGIFARRGMSEAALAAGLGSNGVLLRATFDPDGRLVWSALASDGVRLKLPAFGAGSPGDLSRLRWATARHDFRIGYAHWFQEFRPFLGVYGCQDLLEALHGTDNLQAAAEPIRKSVARLFRLLTWPDPDRTSEFANEALRFAEDLILNPTKVPLWRELDQATSAFIEEVEAIWKLAPLAKALSPDTNLVIQVDDALHAVPVAWLPVCGEPLFRQVRSVRVSLAPALDLLMGDLEREARENGARPRRMLSISSFERDDPARSGGRWLHHGQLHLATVHGYECLAGADREGGTVGAIRGALDQYQRFETAAICGHGDFELAGIVLSESDGGRALWQGDGCDLGGIEWLLLVSCSIGRTAQTGELDVEGFCVQLATHHARSVAACRWPVLSVQAAAFANEAVHQYLRLVAEEPHSAMLRARALNLARRRFSEEDSDRPLVGLNTAAAFELYGLG